MATKKPEEIRKIRNPVDGSTEVQYTDGTTIRTNPDGSKDFIDAAGKSLTKLSITETQIEAWKKQPKEQALKEALELFKAQGMDITEAKFKLEVLKFISELQGATQPAPPQGMQMLAVHINIAQPPIRIKDVEARAIL